MNGTSRKWLFTAVTFGVLVLLTGLAISSYQRYRMSKISFIIWDNQHENAAGLAREDLVRYIEQCGGSVDSSIGRWTVRYNGVFQHREWTFRFASPPASTR
jgi:hypothetical protein